MKPLWLYRPLLNIRPVLEFAQRVGVTKVMPPEHLHATLATVRPPCDWDDLALETDEIIIPAGMKKIQIFGFHAKGLTFGHERFSSRHAELARLYPAMDHASLLRPHVTLYRGGKMPRGDVGYEGELVFGPEIAVEFDEVEARGIKHVKLADYLNAREDASV
jgi:hypothetical protein